MTECDPRLAIALITYERTEYAVKTIRSVQERLNYQNVGWYVADDGSRDDHMQAIYNTFDRWQMIGYHHEQMGVGRSQNQALKACFEWADYVLVLEDDWELRRPLDPRPYLRILQHNPDVGMVRLGHLPINLDTRSVAYDEYRYLLMSRRSPYAFSGNPSIRHRRFHEWYGGYNDAAVRAGDAEVDFDHRFRSKEGPNIIWPVDIGSVSPWGHIGMVRTEDLT